MGTRRGNNEGSIYKTKDGKWFAQATVGRNASGHIVRKTFTGKSRTEVAKKLALFITANNKPNVYLLENALFNDAMDNWLLACKKPMVTGRTFERIYREAKNHIYPKTEGLKIREVNTYCIQTIINWLYDKGIAVCTIAKCKQLISQFYDYYITNGYPIMNPAKPIRINLRREDPRLKEKYKAIPIELRQRLYEELKKDRFLQALCMTMWMAGLRIGETLALKWKDVDLKNNVISVTKAVSMNVKIDSWGNVVSRAMVVGDTKTVCSVRVVPIPSILKEILNEWREDRYLTGKIMGIDLLSPEMYVFADDKGFLRAYRSVDTRFKRFLESHNLAEYSLHFHCFRHTYSNMMFENCVNPKMIQQLLGHSDVQTTIETYNSIDKQYYEKTIKLINKEFKKFD